MKNSYPIVIDDTHEEKERYVVYIPDFDINTEGNTITEAIEMSRDAIGLVGIDMEDDKKELPKPTDIQNISHSADEIVTLVDVDFVEYRRQNESRSVRRNVTIPAWMNFEANKNGINVSAVLQNALKKELHMTK